MSRRPQKRAQAGLVVHRISDGLYLRVLAIALASLLFSLALVLADNPLWISVWMFGTVYCWALSTRAQRNRLYEVTQFEMAAKMAAFLERDREELGKAMHGVLASAAYAADPKAAVEDFVDDYYRAHIRSTLDTEGRLALGERPVMREIERVAREEAARIARA